MLFKKNFGFTLIELVIVIVILGILSVTAIPKFIDLSSNAKGATLQAINASLSTGVNLIQTKAIIQGKHDIVAADTLTFDGLTFTIYNQGVPREVWNNGFKELIDGDFKHLGSGTSPMDTICAGNDFCVIDFLKTSNVITGKEGYGIFFIPKGHKLADKNCFAYYSFQILSGLLVYRETDAIIEGC